MDLVMPDMDGITGTHLLSRRYDDVAVGR